MSQRYRILALVALAGFGIWFFVLRWPRRDYANFPPTVAGPWVAFGVHARCPALALDRPPAIR